MKRQAPARDPSPAKQSFSQELPGTVCAQYRRRGTKTYGPYWFRFWREGGKLRKSYIRKPDIDPTREACQNRRQRRAERRRSQSLLGTQRARLGSPIGQIYMFKETFAVMELLERKEDHELTELQRKRVARLLANFKRERHE